MFKWFKKKDRNEVEEETLRTIATVQPQLMAEIMNSMLQYDVFFSYPRNIPPVPASKIIKDLQDAGWDVENLIYEIISGRSRVPNDDGCRIILIKKW